MASVKEMRTRIGSVKSTQKITKAMQMVAAAKLRRAQDAAQAARPYADKMGAVISSLAGSMAGNPAADRLLVGTGSDQVQLVIVATSDRGLCGGFNTSIVKKARQHIEALLKDGKDVKIFCIGRKGRDQLRRTYAKRIVGSADFAGVKRVTFADIAKIGRKIIEMYHANEFDVATLFYSKFKSVVTQIPTGRQLIPAVMEETAPQTGTVYEYEPDEKSILEQLLPQNISIQLLAAVLENQAGFFASQMAAMDNATRNAGDLINSLTIQMNRTRQAQITKELIEIISGAAAV